MFFLFAFWFLFSLCFRVSYNKWLSTTMVDIHKYSPPPRYISMLKRNVALRPGTSKTLVRISATNNPDTPSASPARPYQTSSRVSRV